MKNILVFFMVLLGLTSCSKDSLDISLDQLIRPDKSEIMVNVTYLHWADQCEVSCGNSGQQSLSNIANATVTLFEGAQTASEISGSPVLNIRTNESGVALLENIEPAVYTIYVDTPLGKKSRIVTSQLHKRSVIDFSF